MRDGTRARAQRPQALLIDRCQETRDRISDGLTQSGYDVTEVVSPILSVQDLRRARPELIVCRLDDLQRGTASLLQSDPAMARYPVLTYTEHSRPSEITRALEAGVGGVFEYPAELEALCESARRMAPDIANALSGDLLEAEFIGAGRAIARIRARILALSQLQVPVLVRGEPGSGRRHTARLICGRAQPPIEVEPDTTPGRLHKEPRTYFLREVDSFSPQAQGFWAHTLRRDSGSPKIRVLASASQDVGRLAKEGGFDAELAAALTRLEVRIPPLRERREDIPALAERLCQTAASALGRPKVRMTRGALTALQKEAWPENLRGLQLIVEQAVAFASDGVIGVGDIRALLDQGSESVQGLRSSRGHENKEALIRELREAGGNLAEVGRRLGISRGAVIYRAQKYGLLPEPARSKRKPEKPRTPHSG